MLGPGYANAEPAVLQTADFLGFPAALDAYRRHSGPSGPFAKAAVCVAGPVTESRAKLTSCDRDLTLPGLSGPGLKTLCEILADMAGMRGAQATPPDDIAVLARIAKSPIAIEAVSLFTRRLGAVAGDLALILGARGRVYIAGGTVNRWGRAFDSALFRERFEAKGRIEGFLARIPTWVITDPYPAFKGLAALV